MNKDFRTGVTDEHYDLISVLYHTLQDCEVVGRYVQDAQAAGDDELVGFFAALQEEDRKRADRVKDLLMRRMNFESQLADSKMEKSRSEVSMSEMR
jgi:hypothetical protein